MSAAAQPLPELPQQADGLIQLAAREVAGFSVARRHAAAAVADVGNALLVMYPGRTPTSALAPLLEHTGKPGFVVVDMPDVDELTPTDSVTLPESPLYLVGALERGDDMTNWSPDEALPALAAADRTPLTVGEGMHWLLQRPDVLERGHCFMTIASRLHTSTGALDARTPALWISNGTGRDGRETRGAPKVGWCWAGNRHAWLGFASSGSRSALTS